MEHVPVELIELRTQANKLGLHYHHRAGIAKIQGIIDAHLASKTSVEPSTLEPQLEVAPGPSSEVPVEATSLRIGETANVTPNNQNEYGIDLNVLIEPTSEKGFMESEKTRRKKEVGKLIRCRIQCMNPNKKDWPGEIISVGSAKFGTFKKYVPFNAEPYHIPKIIYDMLKESKCSVFYNTTNRRGHKTRRARQINQYSIEVLAPLTQQELKDLQIKQAMAKGKESEHAY